MATLKRKWDPANLDNGVVLRKMKVKSYDSKVAAKKLWIDLVDANSDASKTAEISGSLFNMIHGKAATLVFAHDTSRAIQAFVKVATPEHRAIIFDELKGHILTMIKSKFAKYVVRKLLKYGAKEQKLEIINILKGHIATLLKHKEACVVIEYIYNDFATASQKAAMDEELYGPAFNLHKNEKTKNLQQFVEQFPDQVEHIVDFLGRFLTTLVQKNILQLSFVHKLLHDYFTLADQHRRGELIELLETEIPHLVHTKHGSRVAMMCIWHGKPKTRKLIVKKLKEFIDKLCREEYGHFVLLAVFDCVDDTRLMQKALLDEIMKCMKIVPPQIPEECFHNDQYARKVILYLLAPRDQLFFHPDVVRILSEGDDNSVSKKDPAVRRKELLDYISAPMLNWATENINIFQLDNALLLLLGAILTNCTGDLAKAMTALAKLVAEPFVNSPNRAFHYIDNASGHLLLKKLLEKDVKRKHEENPVLFSKVLMDVVTAENIRSWIQCNRGCFVVIKLLEVKDEEVTAKVKGALANCKSTLKKSSTAGSEILLKKL